MGSALSYSRHKYKPQDKKQNCEGDGSNRLPRTRTIYWEALENQRKSDESSRREGEESGYDSASPSKSERLRVRRPLPKGQPKSSLCDHKSKVVDRWEGEKADAYWTDNNESRSSSDHSESPAEKQKLSSITPLALPTLSSHDPNDASASSDETKIECRATADKLTSQRMSVNAVRIDDVLIGLEKSGNARGGKPHDFDNLKHEIARIIEERSSVIKAVMICPAPGGNFRRLLVQAQGITSVEHELKQLEKKFLGFKIFVSDTAPVHESPEGLPIYTRQLNGSNNSPTFSLNLSNGSNGSKRTAAISSFLTDNQKEHGYAATVSHALVEMEQQLDVSKMCKERKRYNQEIRKISGQLMQNFWVERMPCISSLDGDLKMKVMGVPLLAIQHYVPTKNHGQEFLVPCQRFMMDFMLLPVSSLHIFDDQLRKTPKDFVNKYHRDVFYGQTEATNQKPFVIRGFLDVQNEEDIEQLRLQQVSVIIAGMLGTIEVAPVVDCGGKLESGIHIAFQTNNWLNEGHSGEALLVFNRTTQELYILGILSGELMLPKIKDWSDGKPLYQAMVFAPALKFIEMIYPDHLNGELKMAVSRLAKHKVSDCVGSLLSSSNS